MEPRAMLVLVFPTAHGRTLMLLLPAAPPPPASVPGATAEVIWATPLAGLAPRLVPRTNRVELFSRVMLARFRLACCAAFGVTLIVVNPLVSASAPAVSEVGAATFPLIVTIAPREVIGAESDSRLLLLALALSSVTPPEKS